jgi:hypothetical protein
MVGCSLLFAETAPLFKLFSKAFIHFDEHTYINTESLFFQSVGYNLKVLKFLTVVRFVIFDLQTTFYTMCVDLCIV